MTKLLVVSDGAKAWLELTVNELAMELANASLTPSKSRFESPDDALRELAHVCYLRGYMDVFREAGSIVPKEPKRPTPFEEAEAKVLAAPDVLQPSGRVHVWPPDTPHRQVNPDGTLPTEDKDAAIEEWKANGPEK